MIILFWSHKHFTFVLEVLHVGVIHKKTFYVSLCYHQDHYLFIYFVICMDYGLIVTIWNIG